MAAALAPVTAIGRRRRRRANNSTAAAAVPEAGAADREAVTPAAKAPGRPSDVKSGPEAASGTRLKTCWTSKKK